MRGMFLAACARVEAGAWERSPLPFCDGAHGSNGGDGGDFAEIFCCIEKHEI